MAQQLREATLDGQAPRYWVRDADRQSGAEFAVVAKVSGIEVLRIPHRAARANAMCERFRGTVRRECLDRFLILSEGQWYRVLKEYVAFRNAARPDQCIDQEMPGKKGSRAEEKCEGKIIAFPVLNGLQPDDRRVA